MLLFNLLQSIGLNAKPDDCKIHLAVHNGIEDPLDVFLDGRFDDWQKEQTKRNFQRPHIIGLIKLAEKGKWLFTGVYDSHGCGKKDDQDRYHYKLSRRSESDELEGRLVVAFKRTGRQSYPNGDSIADQLFVSAIRPEKMVVIEFPGYSSVTLSKRHLDIIVRSSEPTWRGALSNVAGVYLIADTSSGKQYVGSATGSEGIWSRWSEYSRTGHGGNLELRNLLKEEGAEHARHFQYGVLEIADAQADGAAMLERESYWKDLLLTREYGLNAN